MLVLSMEDPWLARERVDHDGLSAKLHPIHHEPVMPFAKAAVAQNHCPLASRPR